MRRILCLVACAIVFLPSMLRAGPLSAGFSTPLGAVEVTAAVQRMASVGVVMPIPEGQVRFLPAIPKLGIPNPVLCYVPPKGAGAPGSFKLPDFSSLDDKGRREVTKKVKDLLVPKNAPKWTDYDVMIADYDSGSSSIDDGEGGGGSDPWWYHVLCGGTSIAGAIWEAPGLVYVGAVCGVVDMGEWAGNILADWVIDWVDQNNAASSARQWFSYWTGGASNLPDFLTAAMYACPAGPMC